LELRKAIGLPDVSVFQTEWIRGIPLGYHFRETESKQVPEPFHPLDYVLCAVALFLVGIVTVPLMTALDR